MLAKVWSAALVGLDAVPVEVEVDISSQGLPSFTIVGLADRAVEEARERVRSALKNSGAEFPAKRITVNLAPADLPKEGPSYDLTIAIGILLASEQLRGNFQSCMFMGELALEGRLRHTNGVLPQALLAREKHIKNFFLPKMNAKEASCIAGVTIYPVETLSELFFHLNNTNPIDPYPYTPVDMLEHEQVFEYDLQDIKGQEKAKRALEIAAAGSHNMLMKGPPGAGKTLLARTLPSILPTLTFSEILEITKIYSISGLLNGTGLLTNRPFRSPHHTTSTVGLIGGGANPRPGEISLSHRGILFLDELPEFPRVILESMRQTLEDGFVAIARAQGRVVFPAKCMMVAAQNPCPCGYLGDNSHNCSCAPGQIIRYQKKISGPLLDRIDIHLEVPAVKTDKLATMANSQEGSKEVRDRVQKARNLQTARFVGTSLSSNADMSSKDIKLFCALSDACLELLRNAVDKMHLSARSYYRTINLARTIADLVGVKDIEVAHLAEALQYRPRSSSL